MDDQAVKKVRKIYFMKNMLSGYGLKEPESEITSTNIVNGYRKIPMAVAREIKPFMPNIFGR